jgi:hypothetical protein
MAAKRRNPGKLFLILRKVCFSDKPPYLITLFLALLIYTLNNIINHELESPVICYTFEDISAKDGNSFTTTFQHRFDAYYGSHLSLDNLKKKHQQFLLENISLSKSIKQLKIIVKFRDNESAGLLPVYFFNETLIPVSPAAVQYVTGSKALDDIRSGQPRDLIEFQISNFQPDSKYILNYDVAYNSRISADPVLYMDADTPVRLREKGWKEFMLSHRFSLNIGLLTFTLILLMVYLYISYKSYETENSPDSHLR